MATKEQKIPEAAWRDWAKRIGLNDEEGIELARRAAKNERSFAAEIRLAIRRHLQGTSLT